MNTETASAIDVFSPCALGPLQLRNRVVMAPLTRSRAEKGNLPSHMAQQYYSQRAGAGLIVTEATQAGAGGQGYIATPGVHTDAQVQGWKKVTSAVHDAGAKIVLQLMHVGRIAHSANRSIPMKIIC